MRPFLEKLLTGLVIPDRFRECPEAFQITAVLSLLPVLVTVGPDPPEGQTTVPALHETVVMIPAFPFGFFVLLLVLPVEVDLEEDHQEDQGPSPWIVPTPIPFRHHRVHPVRDVSPLWLGRWSLLAGTLRIRLALLLLLLLLLGVGRSVLFSSLLTRRLPL